MKSKLIRHALFIGNYLRDVITAALFVILISHDSIAVIPKIVAGFLLTGTGWGLIHNGWVFLHHLDAHCEGPSCGGLVTRHTGERS